MNGQCKKNRETRDRRPSSTGCEGPPGSLVTPEAMYEQYRGEVKPGAHDEQITRAQQTSQPQKGAQPPKGLSLLFSEARKVLVKNARGPTEFTMKLDQY